MVNGDIVERIYKDNYDSLKLTAREELNEYKAKFDVTTDFHKNGEAWSYVDHRSFCFF